MALEISEVEHSLEYSSILVGSSYAAVSDAVFWMVRDSDVEFWKTPEGHAEEFEQWTHIGLECLLNLYERLLLEESGEINFSTGRAEVEIEDGDVRLSGNPAMVGTIGEFKQVVRTLLRDIILRIDADGGSSREACESANRLYEDSPLDAVDLRAELLATYGGEYRLSGPAFIENITDDYYTVTRSLAIRDLDIWVKYPDSVDPEDYAMGRHELRLMTQLPAADEPEFVAICLRDLFTLYSRLVAEEPGDCLGHLRYIKFDGDRARMIDTRQLVEIASEIAGTIDEFKETFRPLLVEGLQVLEQEGIDSEAVCEELRSDCEDSPFDPVEFRERVL
ncbi:hypothetical protein [Halobacterium jilantaiense]|uniref:Uncharacterized protein n=1 Tax=Halobacterium jilantaiense TaxID=355548 RepID=A0A1I0PA63_9EURY|nr:hypothetical protein [Halobacterium jilantaiense]SEW10458.1 hypothetical protein SAMN04487945_1474 [Halobacterium jilantaiense]